MRQVRKSSSLIGFSFGLHCLQRGGQSQRFQSLHPSLGRTASREWVVSTVVCNHHAALYLINQRFLSILRCFLIGTSAVKSLIFQLSVKFLKLQTALQSFFRFGDYQFVQEDFQYCEFVVILLWMKWF